MAASSRGAVRDENAGTLCDDDDGAGEKRLENDEVNGERTTEEVFGPDDAKGRNVELS
jgi:hypothetical protein